MVSMLFRRVRRERDDINRFSQPQTLLVWTTGIRGKAANLINHLLETCSNFFCFRVKSTTTTTETNNKAASQSIVKKL